ncbi:MAG: molybdopterin-containing oxidoreductase family protein [Pseudomonadales bacterium]
MSTKSRAKITSDAETTISKRTFCRVCEPACGLIARVRDDQLIALEADADHPISKGFVCNKGIYGKDLHNDPDRLRYPLKRNTAGGFDRISWQQALTEIAERLQQIKDQHGSQSLASYTGNPSAFNSLFGPSFGNFVRQLQIPYHFSSGTQDCANKFAGSEAVFGTRTLHPVPDIDRSDFIVLIGENPAVSHMSFVSMPHPMQHLKDAQERGARVLFVNPRKIESAYSVGEHLPIKPDTDVYLLAALLHAIDTGPGFDKDAHARGQGVEELRAFVAEYPPERVAAITGISAEQIHKLALEFAAAKRACVHMSTGVNMGRQGTLAYWLLHMLALVSGNLGRAGGNVYSLGFYARSPAAGRNGPRAMQDTPYGEVRKPGGVGINLPGNLLANYLRTGSDGKTPLRALLVNSGNPVLSIAGETHMRQALDQLDLLVCTDIYPNATADHAHYILPAAGAFEREDINITGLGLQYQPSVQFTEAMVRPGFERRPDWWIFEKLSQVMGFDSALHDDAGFDSPEPEAQARMWSRIDAMLRSRDHSMSELRDKGILTFDRSEPEALFDEHLQHEDQRLNCFPEQFDAARTRMAVLFDQLQSEPVDTLKLISKRDSYMLNSWYSNLPKLKKRERGENYLFMHPTDAAKRQIADGTPVQVSNEFGDIEVKVSLNEDLMPGVVAMTHGWGHANSRALRTAKSLPGVNCNVLLPSGPGSFEPISNQAHMTGVAVDVRPAVSA